MERLTEFRGGIWGMSKQAIEDGYDKYSVFSKLAAYEDTGLTPDDVTELERKYLNDEHEYCGEYGTDDCQFAYRIDKVKQERDFWEREAKKYCAALGEQRIKFQQPDCDKISKQKNGKCLVYCYSETDDEPIDACKYCELYESYEDAD